MILQLSNSNSILHIFLRDTFFLDVGEGNVDVGITGIDVVEESLVDVNRILVSYFVNN
jgi:ATP phosphoribosyltransferase